MGDYLKLFSNIVTIGRAHFRLTADIVVLPLPGRVAVALDVCQKPISERVSAFDLIALFPFIPIGRHTQ